MTTDGGIFARIGWQELGTVVAVALSLGGLYTQVANLERRVGDLESTARADHDAIQRMDANLEMLVKTSRGPKEERP